MFESLKQRFCEQADYWLKENRDGQLRLIENLLLATTDDPAVRQAFDVFVAAHPDGEMDSEGLAQVLEPALLDFHRKEMEKGRQIVRRHESGRLPLRRQRNEVYVRSQSKPDVVYTVSLPGGICTCKSGDGVRYLGLWCQHACAVALLFTNGR